MDDEEASRDLPDSLLFDLLGIFPLLTLAAWAIGPVAALRPAVGYWEKLDEVEDRHGWWLKPASWAACAIGGAAVYWGMGRAIWAMLAG